RRPARRRGRPRPCARRRRCARPLRRPRARPRRRRPARCARSPATASRGTACRRTRSARAAPALPRDARRSAASASGSPASLGYSAFRRMPRAFTLARDLSCEERLEGALKALVSSLAEAAGECWRGAALGGALGLGEGFTPAAPDDPRGASDPFELAVVAEASLAEAVHLEKLL